MHGGDEEGIREEADGDRRCANEHVAREPDPAGPPRDVVLRKVDPAEDPDRDRHHRGQADQDPRAHDRVCHPGAGNADGTERVREDLDVERRREALADGEPENQAERNECQHGECVHDGEPARACITAPNVPVHAARLTSREVERTSSRATTLTMRVTRMSTSPSSISAAGWYTPVASVNSFAITADSV